MNILCKEIFCLLFICLIVTGAFSQSNKHTKKADQKFYEFDYLRAIELYQIEHLKDSENAYITRKIGDSYRALGDPGSSEEWYRKTISLDNTHPSDVLYLAEALKCNAKYAEAVQQYEVYGSLMPGDSRSVRHLKDPEYYKKLEAMSAFYDVKGMSLNMDVPAFGISSFENKYLFASPATTDGGSGKSNFNDLHYLDIFVGEKDENNKIVNIQAIEGNINTAFHDGPACYDKYSKSIFVTRNNLNDGELVRDSEGKVNLKIYQAKAGLDRTWSDVQEMAFNSDEYSCAHPCISSDGQKLFFVSNRPGGSGETDIYVIEKQGDSWSAPKNLGASINTEGTEMFPFAHPNGGLFFASDGQAGLGGLDIFHTHYENGIWSEPINLGARINTTGDDFGMMYDGQNEQGFFSSNGGTGLDSDDVLAFHDMTAMRQLVVGKVIGLEDHTGEPKIRMKSLDSGEEMTFPLLSDGTFEFPALLGENYTVSFLDDVMEKELDSFLTPDIKRKEAHPLPDLFLHEDIVADTIIDESTGDEIVTLPDEKDGSDTAVSFKDKTGPVKDKAVESGKLPPSLMDEARLVLQDVFFDYNDHRLRAEDKVKLKGISDFMGHHPEVKIKINAHADSQGSAVFNDQLSKRRADSVKQYLRSQGIAPDRLKTNWFGENELRVKCPNEKDCDEQSHQQNRRAEFQLDLN